MADDEAQQPLAKVLLRPGIPVVKKPGLSMEWVIMWFTACFVVFVLPLMLGKTLLYSQTNILLGDEPQDLLVNMQGCDVVFEPSYTNYEIRLGYWTFMGSGVAKQLDGRIEVNASMTRKALGFHCLLVVMLPPWVDAHFKSMSVTLEPSSHALTLPHPSNVAEMPSLYIGGVKVEKVLHVNVTTMCETTLHNTAASFTDVHIQGGSLSVLDGEPSAGAVHIKADNANVIVRSERSDIILAVDNTTARATSVAGLSLEALAGDGEWTHRHRLVAKHHQSKYTLNVKLKATDSAVYGLAVDAPALREAGECPELVAWRGELAAGEPRVASDGVGDLQELRKWLKSPTNAVEFSVYIHVPPPQAGFNGKLKLVSTEIYTALSPIGFALLSGGAMEPYVVRLSIPMLGMPWTFPGSVCASGPSAREVFRFGEDVLKGVDSIVDIHDLGLHSAKWVWEGQDQPTYIFDHVSAKNGRSARWKPRLLSALSSFTFRAASGITMFVGVLAGFAICKVLWMTLRPLILAKIRTADLFATASYRLQHTTEAAEWTVAATFIMWPMAGILMRWSKRPQRDNFVTFTFVARAWPPSDGDGEIHCSGIDAWRLPSCPSLPDQECFLFCANPGNERRESPWFPDKFDVELYTLGMLQYGRQQPELHIGRPYQLQVIAKDAAGQVVEKSDWSRPTVVQPPRAFTEYPLQLWRAQCGRIPENTLLTFLQEHCHAIEPSPTLVLELSNIKFAADSNSTLFCGEAVGVYGAEAGALMGPSPAQQVKISVSTGGAIGLYETTHMVPLPTQEERAEDKDLVKKFEDALPGKPRGFAPGLENSQFVVLDFPSDTLSLEVSYDLTASITIEAAVESETGEEPLTAKLVMTWQQILDAVRRSSIQRVEARRRSTRRSSFAENMVVPVVGLDLVLRDGLTPVGILSCQCSFSNTVLGQLAPPARQPGPAGLPDVFHTMLPGSTFVWGETITLSWEREKGDRRAGQGQLFDIVLVSEGYDPPGYNSHNYCKNQRTETVLSSGTGANWGKQGVTLAPNQPATCQLMRCRLEARAHGPLRSSVSGSMAAESRGSTAAGGLPRGTVMASSWDFLITRPVTLQQLELFYAAFCIRNRIPMQTVPQSATADLMIETVERRLYNCTGYRAPMPMPSEVAEEVEDTEQGPLVVENSSSFVITGPDGLRVPIHQRREKTSTGSETQAAGDASPSAGQPGGQSDLQEPLLSTEAGQGPKVRFDEPKEVPTKDVFAKCDSVIITTNVFWKWTSPCLPHLFLKYWFMPRLAEPTWWRAKFQFMGWNRVAELENLDFAVRYILGTALYCGQMGVMGFPGLLLFTIWLWHDSVVSKMTPDLTPNKDAHNLVLVDFVISPNFSRWYHIPTSAKVVYITLMGYIGTVVLMAFYCNFLHFNRTSTSNFFPVMNWLVSGLWAFSFFLSIVLVTVVLVWIIMGALVNPEILLPYAIMLLAVGGLFVTLHGKMSDMADHASKGIRHTLENVLRSVFEVFVENPEADAQLEAFRQELESLAVSITENMEQLERDMTGALLKESTIITEVPGFLRTQMDTLRGSAYYTTWEGQCMNKTLLTDFTPGDAATKASIIGQAQQIAIDTATIQGTNMLGTSQTTTSTAEDGTQVATTCAAAAPPITAASLSKAVANHRGLPMEKPGDLSATVRASVPRLSSQLLVNPATALAAVNGYVLQLQLARTKRRPAKMAKALSAAKVFSRTRHDRLLSHFMPRETTQEDGTVTKECNVDKMLLELQKSELEDLPSQAATVFTNFIDWTVIGRVGETYIMSTLVTRITTRAINEQLSPVLDGSAAFELVMQASELAFAKTASVYSNDPLQIFVDCGIIQLRHKHLPETQRILTDTVNGQRAFDNSLGPLNVLSAVKVLVLPECKPEPVNDIPGRSYLWYGALLRILKKLGWTEEEMASEFLGRRWRSLTEGTGLYEYESLEEVNDLIFKITNEGLWKAAVQGLMLEVQVGGFVGHDVMRDGREKAAKAAHHLAEDVDRGDLEAVRKAAGQWPDYLEAIWRQTAQQRSAIDPFFLQSEKVLDFLQDFVYTPASPGSQTFTQLSPFAASTFDLVWTVGADKTVWHSVGGSRRQLRGLWLELALKVFSSLDCVPTDLDIFFQSLAWQFSEQQPEATSQLQLSAFGDWLRAVYFKDQLWCTFNQFKTIMLSVLKVDIPEAVLHEQVFMPCPKDPNDDLGELRRLSDLGGALQTWLGYGLWPSAIEQVVEEFLPRGRVLNVAKTILHEEFQKLDPDGLGVLQPGPAVLLIHRLTVPGLTCEDMKMFIDSQLSCDVPEREVHKYFVMMDVNGDGVLSAEEFIPLFVYFIFDFFPAQILQKLGLGPGNVAAFLVGVLGILSLVFALVSLVISAFPTGRTISASIHTIVSGATAWGAKQSSDKSIGFEDTMTNLKKELEKRAMEAVVGVLGISQAVVEKFTSLTTSVL